MTQTKAVGAVPTALPDAAAAAAHISHQVKRLTITSLCLSTAAFICSMVGSLGFTSSEFTPAAFALTLFHHGALLFSGTRRTNFKTQKPSAATIAMRGKSNVPLSAWKSMVSIIWLTVLLWLVAIASNLRFLSLAFEGSAARKGVATLLEFLLIVFEVVVMSTLGILSTKERRVVLHEG